MRTGPAAVTAALILTVAIPGTSQAASPWVATRYHDTFSDSFDDCGFTIEFEGRSDGRFKYREVPGSNGEAFLGHDNFSYRIVFTNPDTGAYFVQRGRALFKEMSARQIEGNVWEFTSHEVGQPFVIENSDGDVVIRDRGLIVRRALFDTEGDGQPGGILLEIEILRVAGPHPGLFSDFCEIAADLIG